MADDTSIKSDLLSAFRDFQVEGVPASGEYEPDKAAIRDPLGRLADRVETVAASVSAGVRGYALIADLPSLTEADAGQLAKVEEDGNVYRWSGTSWEVFDDPTIAAAGRAEADADRAEDAALSVSGLVSSEEQLDEVLSYFTDPATAFAVAALLRSGGWETRGYRTGPSRDDVIFQIEDALGFIMATLSRQMVLGAGGIDLAFDPGSGSLLEVRDRQGFVFARLGVDGSEIAGLSEQASVAPLADAGMLLDGALYGIEGRPLPFYLRNTLPNRGDEARLVGAVACDAADDGSRWAYTQEGSGFLILEPERLGPTLEVSLRQADRLPSRRWTASLTTHVAPATGSGSPKVLLIGDSITNRRIAWYMDKKLRAMGYTPSFIGTLNGTGPADGNSMGSGGLLGEGHEGWQYSDFTKARLSTGGRSLLVDPGQEAAYLALPKAEKIEYNPFIRVAVGGDDPAVVRNGFVFDFAYYLDRFGLDAPDVVLIGLGTNDIVKQPIGAGVENIIDGMQLMTRQIRAAAPAARIGLWMPTVARDAERDQLWSAGYVPAIREMIRFRRAKADPLLNVINVWAHHSPETGFLLGTVSTDPATGVITGDVSDATHPLRATRHQIVEALTAYVAVVSN